MIYKAVLLAVLSLFARLSGQMPGEQRLTANLELHQVSTPEASLAILKSLLRHGGIVDTSAAGCNPPERHSVFVPWGADTSTALDLGVPRDGRWLWILDGDVVNVLPRESLPAVLHLTIASFQWDIKESATAVVSRLFALPPVRQFLVQHGIRSALQSGFGLQKPPRLIDGVPAQRASQTYGIKDVTVLAALNRIVASYGRLVWMYSETDCKAAREYLIQVK